MAKVYIRDNDDHHWIDPEEIKFVVANAETDRYDSPSIELTFKGSSQSICLSFPSKAKRRLALQALGLMFPDNDSNGGAQ